MGGGFKDSGPNPDLELRTQACQYSILELFQGDRIPAEIEGKEEKGNEVATIDEDEEAVKWKPKSR